MILKDESDSDSENALQTPTTTTTIITTTTTTTTRLAVPVWGPATDASGWGRSAAAHKASAGHPLQRSVGFCEILH
eukprot:14453409-Heterocapsa_arctica.AAC.1